MTSGPSQFAPTIGLPWVAKATSGSGLSPMQAAQRMQTLTICDGPFSNAIRLLKSWIQALPLLAISKPAELVAPSFVWKCNRYEIPVQRWTWEG